MPYEEKNSIFVTDSDFFTVDLSVPSIWFTAPYHNHQKNHTRLDHRQISKKENGFPILLSYSNHFIHFQPFQIFGNKLHL